MEVKIYAIYDTKAKAYLQPWFAANNAVAFRNCQRACANAQSPFAEFPVDFTLFCVGLFDDDSGEISALKHHENLGNFTQFLPAAAADTAA